MTPCSLVVMIVGLLGDPSTERPISFNKDIRPILSENCFKCHGPDARQRKGDVRLDLEKEAKAELPTGSRAIGPSVDASELAARVTSTDPDVVMPPPDTGKKLSADQIDLLKNWIEQGAAWEGHWSLLPITRPEVPEHGMGGFIRNPIDVFVAQGLRAQKITPSAEADRATLIRRLYFDLIGLPPEPNAVKKFVEDNDDGAYERVVEELLASPHFGERMAIFWLDLVRYADSVGYHGDQPVSVSPFRDYVIRSFNENKPFDQFTIEQLAGDLLENPTRKHRIASGYNRLGMMSAEGGVQDREYRAKYAAERVRNLSGTWLGLTLGCCECHDHKFDPFTTAEFYSMEAFFADIKEYGFYPRAFPNGDWGPSIPVPTLEQEQKLAAISTEIASVRAEFERSTPSLEQEQRAWEAATMGSAPWTPVQSLSAVAKSGATLKIMDDQSILAMGATPATDVYSITARVPIQGITAFRVEVLPDESLPSRGPGRAANGNFVLTGFSIGYQRAPQGKSQPILLDNATATFEQAAESKKTKHMALSAASILDPTPGVPWGWAIAPEAGKPQHAVFETIVNLHGEPDGILTFALTQEFDNPSHVIGRFRISATNAARPVRATGAGVPTEIRNLLAIPTSSRSDAQRNQLAAYYRSIAPSLAPFRQKLADLEKSKQDFEKTITTTLVTESVEPRTIRVLARGNWMDESGAVVSPALPAVLPQGESKSERMTRLDLARWLVAPDNPLTARTLVNRLWKQLFGAGLSRKLDDLGAQGEPPSHPELLDWLASELIDSRWNIKRLMKLIVMSGAYRQSSVPSAEAVEKDPFNRWIGRQGRFRMDAELVRDNVLATSGLLNRAVGGPSSYPYQPPGYWSFLNFPVREWKNGEGSDLYRRGLYTHWQRQYLHPSLLAFDAPSREECTAERVRSNTPLQSLVLLNDPAYVEAARFLADRVAKEGGATDAERIDWMFHRALSRPALPQEQGVLKRLLDKHREEYSKDPAAAEALSGVGSQTADANVPAAERAAWTSVARVILNLHSFVTRN